MKININALSSAASIPICADVLKALSANVFTRSDCLPENKQTFVECVDKVYEDIMVLKNAIADL
jgi:hypothetical protein